MLTSLPHLNESLPSTETNLCLCEFGSTSVDLNYPLCLIVYWSYDNFSVFLNVQIVVIGGLEITWGSDYGLF
jgi:hypothetical protein